MTTDTDPITLRVLTLNVWNVDGEPERQQLLCDGVAALEPDLVSFQEVVRTPEYDQLAALVAGTELTGVHQLDVAPESSGGTALASRWAPTSVEYARLPGASGEPDHANALAAVIPLPNGLEMLFLAVKPTWRLDGEADRQAEIRTITDLDARLHRPAPTIIAGDFDATPDADCMRYLAGRAAIDGHSVYYHNAWDVAGDGGPGHTWTHENPLTVPIIDYLVRQPGHARRIDHILVGSFHRHPDFTARIQRCEVVLTDPPVSDHYGVLADIEIRPLPVPQ